MRQRLIKVIFCVALSVSVFLFNFCVALAGDDVNTDGSVYTGEFDIVSSDVFESTVFARDSTFYQATMEGRGLITLSFTKQAGYTYQGVIALGLTFAREYGTDASNLGDMNIIGIDANLPDGLSYAFQHTEEGTASSKGILYIFFNDYYSSSNDTLLFSVNVFLLQRAYLINSTTICDLSITVSQATDWAGSIWEYPYLRSVDSESGLLQQQIDQSQQIAIQQSQQSQQQHNSLINGYDNAANDTMLADKNSVLKGFEQQQDQAMSDGQQYVADFSANYDTAPLQAMAPAFMMISTWFNDLWGGMGNFSTVLIVGLMLCVAGYILKLKH